MSGGDSGLVVRKTFIVDPQKYEENQQAIAKAEERLRQMKANNEQGKRNYEQLQLEELRKKIEEGEEAKRKLAELTASATPLLTFHDPASGGPTYNFSQDYSSHVSPAPSARIEEIPSPKTQQSDTFYQTQGNNYHGNYQGHNGTQYSPYPNQQPQSTYYYYQNGQSGSSSTAFTGNHYTQPPQPHFSQPIIAPPAPQFMPQQTYPPAPQPRPQAYSHLQWDPRTFPSSAGAQMQSRPSPTPPYPQPNGHQSQTPHTSQMPHTSRSQPPNPPQSQSQQSHPQHLDQRVSQRASQPREQPPAADQRNAGNSHAQNPQRQPSVPQPSVPSQNPPPPPSQSNLRPQGPSQSLPPSAQPPHRPAVVSAQPKPPPQSDSQQSQTQKEKQLPSQSHKTLPRPRATGCLRSHLIPTLRRNRHRLRCRPRSQPHRTLTQRLLSPKLCPQQRSRHLPRQRLLHCLRAVRCPTRSRLSKT
ncbi:hypothetical protein DFH06DRAFT_290106 [Mycena polygramma]|nr:hypothetical protein DFH06DRAFT_290106 [Mycena polygramma]